MSANAQAAGADAFFACGLAAWVLVVLCDLVAFVAGSAAIDDFDDAIGAEAPMAGLDWANAPKLTAEARAAAMRVFMRKFLVGCDRAESSR
jgi:hypothetical protein